MKEPIRSSPPNPQILDCTLRDGGYLNRWDFPQALVEDHVRLSARSEFEWIEVGFRSGPRHAERFKGLTAYSPSPLIELLSNLAPNKKIGVMVNQSEFPTTEKLLEAFQDERDLHSLGFVRIATVMDHVDISLDFASALKEKGLNVFLNIMQCSLLKSSDIEALAKKELSPNLAGLYFADSFGAMTPTSVMELCHETIETLNLPIGFHFHDNLSLAFANSLAACSAGAEFIDGTMLGLGRGAGNTRTELLWSEFCNEGRLEDMSELVDLWKTWSDNAPDITPWGPSLDYAQAAKFSIHPTYIQSMTESEHYNARERATVIRQLSDRGATRFEEPLLEFGSDWFTSPGITDPEVRDLFEGRNLILVGSGASKEAYTSELANVMQAHQEDLWLVGNHPSTDIPACNIFLTQPLSLVSFFANQPECRRVVAPFSQVPLKYQQSPNGADRISIDLKLHSEIIGFMNGTVLSPSSRSSIAMLALLSGVRPENIALVGFDGYEPGDKRNHEFDIVLRKVREVGIPIYSFTPTSFDVEFAGGFDFP